MGAVFTEKEAARSQSVGRFVGWTNCLNHSTWISVADWQLASDLVLVCDPLEWSLSKLYVLHCYCNPGQGSGPVASSSSLSFRLPHRLGLIYVTRLGLVALLYAALEPRLACKVALTNSTRLPMAERQRERGGERESAKPALQLIALYNVRFPVDITRFAAATLSGPIGGGIGTRTGAGLG